MKPDIENYLERVNEYIRQNSVSAVLSELLQDGVKLTEQYARMYDRVCGPEEIRGASLSDELLMNLLEGSPIPRINRPSFIIRSLDSTVVPEFGVIGENS